LEKLFVNLILDTHILIWWLHDETDKLTKVQRVALIEADKHNRLMALSAITLWEIAMLVERGRIAITKSLVTFLGDVESHPLLAILPLTTSIAAESARLGDDFHRDPADQMIVATARCHGLSLVTADERIRKWGKVNLV
jgi:PIN domain nuclease of toxin-antitoxin system